LSTALSDIPAGATLIEKTEGVLNVPGEPNHGKRASIEVWEAYVSRGSTQARWVVIRVEGEKLGSYDRPAWIKRATGRNIAKLTKELPDLRAMIVIPKPVLLECPRCYQEYPTEGECPCPLRES
jgi:hypothetical protein